MSTKEIMINRDLDNDILYVFKAGHDKAKTINNQLTADIVVRQDYETKEIVGLTIEDFSRALPHYAHYDEYHLKEAFDNVIDFLNAPDLVRT